MKLRLDIKLSVMTCEWRCFIRLDTWDTHDKEELEALLRVVLHDWNCVREAEEVRTDKYFVTGSDCWGAKKRNGKKWEVKYRTILDEESLMEMYVKRKYGKHELSRYAAKIVDELSQLNIPHNALDNLLASVATIDLSKKRNVCSGAISSSNCTEVCFLQAADGPSGRSSSWVSISTESESMDSLKRELQHAKYRSIFQLIEFACTSDSGEHVMRRLLFGGYPCFINALAAAASTVRASAQHATARDSWEQIKLSLSDTWYDSKV